MLSHLHLNPAHKEPVSIPGVPLPRRVTVFIGFVNQSHRDTARYCRQRCVCESLVGDAIHDDVNLLIFPVQADLGAIKEVITTIGTVWKIQRRIDGENRISAF
jgi:hypothetical protein